MTVPRILQGESASERLQTGFNKLTNLLAVTLGPTQGVVLSKHETKPEPELLSDAATIARRILAFPDRAEDVGAMLARNLVWRMHLRAGDGCATAAVLAQSVLAQGQRYIAAGGNAMSLRRGIDRATRVAVEALRAQARPIDGAEDLAKIAETITGDAKLAAVLGEIFGKLGADAHITIEDYISPYLERQFYEGGRWHGRLVTPYFITDATTRRAVVADCHVALYAGTVSSVDDVTRLLQTVAQTQWPQVALIAKEISGAALATLVLNHQQNKLKILAAELRGGETKRQIDFQDLAVLTGARVLGPELGRTLASLEPTDLGASPRVEADADELIVVGGEGDAEAIVKQVDDLRSQLGTAPETSDEAGDLRFRIARLRGQIAKLMIGAHTEAERAFIRQNAEKAIRALPLALREGVVPGGGIAYLNCIPAVLTLAAEGDEAYGVQVVARALLEPGRRILANAGIPAPEARLAEAQHRGPSFGCNAMNGEIVPLPEAGILDSVGILRMALQTAVSGAVMALTTETIVLKRNPQTSFEP